MLVYVLCQTDLWCCDPDCRSDWYKGRLGNAWGCLAGATLREVNPLICPGGRSRVDDTLGTENQVLLDDDRLVNNPVLMDLVGK